MCRVVCGRFLLLTTVLLLCYCLKIPQFGVRCPHKRDDQSTWWACRNFTEFCLFWKHVKWRCTNKMWRLRAKYCKCNWTINASVLRHNYWPTICSWMTTATVEVLKKKKESCYHSRILFVRKKIELFVSLSQKPKCREPTQISQHFQLGCELCNFEKQTKLGPK